MSRIALSTSFTDAGRRAFIGIVLAAAPSLYGCGFTPIHGETSSASEKALNGFEVELIPNRIGQLLRNELLQRFRPRGIPGGDRFSLSVKVDEYIRKLGIRIDETATRANLTLRAAYAVSGRADGAVLIRGTARSVNSYNILGSHFATLIARKNARERAVREIADDIRGQISIWLVRTGGKKAEARARGFRS